MLSFKVEEVYNKPNSKRLGERKGKSRVIGGRKAVRPSVWDRQATEIPDARIL
jgi:hypothetical protein